MVPGTQLRGAGRPQWPARGRRVFIAGVKGVPGDLTNFVRVIHPREYPVARASGGRGSVLVLGDDALLSLDPAGVAKTLLPPACILVGVPRLIPYAAAARWLTLARAELVEVEDWEFRAAEACGSPLRRDLDPSAWVPDPKKTDGLSEAIVARIPHLEDLSPGGLARALGTPAHRLRRQCLDRFDAPPRDLIWSYTRAYTLRRVAEGASRSVIANEVGRPDEGELRKAFRKRGERLPPPARRKVRMP